MFDFKRVVIILPERLGDTLFHTPSIHLLKVCRPDVKIEVIALSALSASVLANNPHIDRIHVLPDESTVQRLARYYDVALNVHDHALTRKYLGWLNIPTITAPPPDPHTHQSRQSLDFFQSLLGCDIPAGEDRYQLFPTTANGAKITALLARNNVATDRDILIGCHIGCHSIAKRGWKFWKPMVHPKVWPFENFVALEQALREVDARFRLVLTGSRSEQHLGHRFTRSAPTVINLIDQTSVLDLAALMSKLKLFVTSDTGTLHVACATSVGIVALFGPTALQRTGPYPMLSHYRVLRAPTIKEISVAQVRAAVTEHPAVMRALRPAARLRVEMGHAER